MAEEDKIPGGNCFEQAPPPKAWRFGMETGIEDAAAEPVDWLALLPSEEVQYQRRKAKSLDSVFDTSGCVTFSVFNSAETQYARLVEAGEVPEAARETLAALGFVVGGKLNLSDRDMAARSGTRKDTGNSFYQVCETFRTVGPIPEADHPFDPSLKTWEAYMVPGPELAEKRRAFLEIFEIQHEYIFWSGDNLKAEDKRSRIKAVLATCPVLTSRPTCAQWSRRRAKAGVEIEDCGVQTGGHATNTVGYTAKNQQLCFDHYEPFLKTLAADFWVQHTHRMVLKVRTQKPAPVKPTLPTGFCELGDRTENVARLQKCLAFLGYQSVLSAEGRPYFGERTREALLAFQLAEQVDARAELIRQNGAHFGPRSKAALERRVRAA